MPVRFRDLKRALEAMGAKVTPSPGGGSHYHVSKGGQMYTIPAGHGLNAEIHDVTVQVVTRSFARKRYVKLAGRL